MRDLLPDAVVVDSPLETLRQDPVVDVEWFRGVNHVVVLPLQSLQLRSEELLDALRGEAEDWGEEPALHVVDQVHLLDQLVQLGRL